MKLYLASTSKHKSKILNTVYLKHTCLSSEHEEHSDQKDVYEYVKELSLSKALNVQNQVSEGIIIGLDTVNFLDGKIIEKPKSKEEALLNVSACSGRKYSIITGVAIINLYTKETIQTYAETKITFKKIAKKDLKFYVDNEPYLLNASGFIVETIMSNFIDKIEGSYYNILGIPVETIYKVINDMGYYLEDIDE